MAKLFDEEMEDIKKMILDGDSPNTKLGEALQDREYIILQMYINGDVKELLDLFMTLCDAELHRMTSEVILWRD